MQLISDRKGDQRETRTSKLAERVFFAALVTTSSAALLLIVGRRGSSRGGCGKTPLSSVFTFSGLAGLRALPRLVAQTRRPSRQDRSSLEYPVGGFAVGLEAPFLT